jgi:predicted PurR-regulated permease PerM
MGRTVELTIRIGALAVLAVWCFLIARPFLGPIVWGIIIAVAAYRTYRRLESFLGGRRIVAAALFTIVMLLALVVPSVMLADSLAAGAHGLAQALQAGSLQVPPPPESVGRWPLVGEPLQRFWLLASEDLQQAVREVGPVLAGFGRWLLGAAAMAGFAVLEFALAIFIAGALLAHADAGARAARAIAVRLAPSRGAELAELAEMTVRSVATGILGVGLLQGLLAGAGFLGAGVPAAGLLTLLCIILGVAQIGVVVVVAPVVIYLFSTADTTTAVAFLVWAILISPVDNILKPILLGRGVQVPMLVIFIGAIGGFIHAGIIGLFIGAVVLALGFKLFQAWLYEEPVAGAGPESQAQGVRQA